MRGGVSVVLCRSDASEIASFGDHDVLRKPFTLAALDQAIRRNGEPRSTETARSAG